MHQKIDIFCKIVDNFGDIGVCWRLAKQLHQEQGLQVRLFVNNVSAANKIMIGIADAGVQVFEGVTIVRLDENTLFESVADIVMETFACGLPTAYLALMTQQNIWVNVDYLSAESWVSAFHGLNGQHHETKLTRHFYFPGFVDDTGGLLREQNLIAQRDAFQTSNVQQQDFWQSLLISNQASDLTISLFYYQHAPVDALLQSLANGEVSVRVCMPLNNQVPISILGYNSLVAGDCLTIDKLTLHILPFLPQDDYDRLLWACDINFVRGEDSWVRAVWAAKPFIWQPYWQEDNTHLLKLNAFLNRFYTHPELHQTIVSLHEAWATESFHQIVWQHYVANLAEIMRHTQQQSQRIVEQQDLASKLLAFCADLAN